jgi:hypothetical protein
MTDVPANIQALLNSLQNPRYATGDPQASAPIEMDGTLDGNPVMFVASPHDAMAYGVDTWNRAQSGNYGTISAFNPTLATVQQETVTQIGVTVSRITKESEDTDLRASLFNVATELEQSVKKANDKAGVKAAIETFTTDLNTIVNSYNAANPDKPISQPAKIVVPGL